MSFEKNKNLDNLINIVNDLLSPIEREQMEKTLDVQVSDSLPTIFLLGAPRSGSTLFTQWAASTGVFGYPSNFLSRFYKAPYIGALIYNMVTDPSYQYKDEFQDINQVLKFSSNIGKTKGFKSPHEFWYFWRRFFYFSDIPDSEENFLKKADFNSFCKELLLLKRAFKKPLLFKAHIINWYISTFSQQLDNVYFIHLYRDPVATTRSLLKAREDWTGSREQWFSFKPREYHLLKEMDMYHQIAGQIYFIDKEILTQSSQLGDKFISLSYESFCRDPKHVFDSLINKLSKFSPDYNQFTYNGETNFVVSNPTSQEDKFIKDAYSFFENEYGILNF